MNDAQENKVSMYFKVIAFFAPNLTTLEVNAPYLTTGVPGFITKVDELQGFATEASGDNTGYTQQKKIYKDAMRDFAVMVSGALQSYFLSIGDVSMAKHAKLTKSEIDKARDTIALYECDRISNMAQEFSAQILNFGATAGMLTELQARVATFKAFIQRPIRERSESKSAGEMFVKKMKECDNLLEIIDGVMLTQKEDHEMLHLQYLNARAIDDAGGGSGEDPDFVFVVLPGSFFTATTIPFEGTRSFEAKNTSAFDIQWGLSTMETSFSNPPNTLNANSSSTKNSVTLGGSGDFLIFENTSGEPVGVELRVIE